MPKILKPVKNYSLLFNSIHSCPQSCRSARSGRRSSGSPSRPPRRPRRPRPTRRGDRPGKTNPIDNVFRQCIQTFEKEFEKIRTSTDKTTRIIFRWLANPETLGRIENRRGPDMSGKLRSFCWPWQQSGPPHVADPSRGQHIVEI